MDASAHDRRTEIEIVLLLNIGSKVEKKEGLRRQ